MVQKYHYYRSLTISNSNKTIWHFNDPAAWDTGHCSSLIIALLVVWSMTLGYWQIHNKRPLSKLLFCVQHTDGTPSESLDMSTRRVLWEEDTKMNSTQESVIVSSKMELCPPEISKRETGHTALLASSWSRDFQMSLEQSRCYWIVLWMTLTEWLFPTVSGPSITQHIHKL